MGIPIFFSFLFDFLSFCNEHACLSGEDGKAQLFQTDKLRCSVWVQDENPLLSPRCLVTSQAPDLIFSPASGRTSTTWVPLAFSLHPLSCFASPSAILLSGSSGRAGTHRTCLGAECGRSAVYTYTMSVYVRWFWWRLLEIWGRLELPLPAAPSLIGIATVLILYFCVYLKMNLRGILEI